MKITGIEIGEYRQFKNIKFDFTYPEGHAKAGQPLEKVCFIGQGGTGKTTLLNVICNFFEVANDGYQISRNRFSVPSVSHYGTFKDGVSVYAEVADQVISFGPEYLRKPSELYIDIDKEIDIDKSVAGSSFDWVQSHNLYETIKSVDKLCLYIDDSAVNHARSLTIATTLKDFGSSSYIVTDNDVNANNANLSEIISSLTESKVLRLDFINTKYIWSYLLNDIDVYNESLREIAVDLIQKKNNFSPSTLLDALNKWQQVNPNPKMELADKCLNPILEKLFLEVDIDGTHAPIVIKTKKGVAISYVILNTGTKQILTTAIPIYKSQIGSGVVLFDEPERSLFPDIQRDLISYYISLAPEAQFFFATHSPIIASAFEPCERFILYFDDNGEVNYHTGIAPEGDDPNDVLSEDFGMNELMLQPGLDAYKRYRSLGVEIKNEKNSKRKDELIVERAKLGDLYRF